MLLYMSAPPSCGPVLLFRRLHAVAFNHESDLRAATIDFVETRIWLRRRHLRALNESWVEITVREDAPSFEELFARSLACKRLNAVMRKRQEGQSGKVVRAKQVMEGG